MKTAALVWGLMLGCVVGLGCSAVQDDRSAAEDSNLSSTAKSPIAVKVLEFNVATAGDYHIGDLGNDVIPNWVNRSGDMLNIIKAQDADLIGLEEATEVRTGVLTVNQYGDLADGLAKGPASDPTNGYTSVFQDAATGLFNVDGALRYDALIFYRTSRFTKLAQGSFALSDTPEKGYSKSWGNFFPRTVLYAQLRDKQTGRALWFVDTHIDNSDGGKQKSIDLVKQELQSRGLFSSGDPIIFCGDFNLDVKDPRFLSLSPDFHDTEPQSEMNKTPPTKTFDTANGDTIDHILVHLPNAESVVVKSWNVLSNRYTDGNGGLSAPTSDHFPIVAELTIP